MKIGDDHGFHGAAGECLTYVMSNGHQTLVMTTGGASGRDQETLTTIRSVRLGDK
jgi:hypothetical protein